MPREVSSSSKFTNIKEFPQGLEGIRNQAAEMMSRDDSNQVLAGKKLLCLYDLKYLCKEVLGFKDWDVIHDEMQESLDSIEYGLKERQYRLYLIPRGHLKSSIITKGWAIQQILRKPNIRILIANAIWDNARGFGRTIMTYLTDGLLPCVFGIFIPKSGRGIKWSPDSFTINQRTMPNDAATVTTTGVERTQTSQHYDIIIMDDLVARENTATKEQREKVKNFYRDSLALLEPDGILIVVGTTWSDDDLYSSEENGLLHDPDYVKFKRVAEQGTEESVLFKNKFSFEGLMKIKQKIGTYLYSSQYLLNPYPDEEMTFKPSWIQYWKYEGEITKGIVLRKDERLFVAMTIDPSLGKERSDYSALVAVGIDENSRKFVLMARRFKRKLEDIPAEIVRGVKDLKNNGHDVHVIGLESFGFQQSLYKPIRNAIEEAGYNIQVEMLPAPNNRLSQKEIRIEGLIPNISFGEVYFHETHKDIINEMLRFNPCVKNKSDDLIDSLAWNKLYWYRKPRKVSETMIIREGSLFWHMRNSGKNKLNDIFSEYRT